METPLQFTSLEVNYDNNNILYAGSTAGMYRTTNRGISWHLYNNMFTPSKKVLGIVKQPGSGDTVIVCTSDAVYKVFRDQLTSSVNSNAWVPGVYELYQNYPNPFNPETVIEFFSPEETQATLTVYDAVGRKVAELLNSRISAGRHSVVFNSATLGSGVYFCRLQAGGVIKSIVMILQK
ncbi:MAG: T9SS type A sorting domain-containing protein [Ignavibacteria bacterium]|nr:T9SS type A sorting domain-containing protein [Ignavibacteria bacterium]